MSSTIVTFIWRAEADEIRERRPFGEALDAEVRRVHAQEHRRRRRHRSHVIGDPRPVRRADLAQQRARLAHHVGNAEAAADFDQLASRDDDLAARRQAGEDQHDRGGVVVDDQRGFGAGDRRDQRFGVHGPRSARTLLEVVFEIAVAARERGDPLDGRVAERRASQVGVDDDAGRVDDGPAAIPAPGRSGRCASGLQWCPPRAAHPRRLPRVPRTESAPERSASTVDFAPCSASSARTPSRFRSISILGMILKSGTRRDHNFVGSLGTVEPPWNRNTLELWNLWNPWNQSGTIRIPLSTERKVSPRREILALRREAGGADRGGACRARSGPAHDAVRSARTAVFDHAGVPAVRRRKFRQGPHQGEDVPGIHRDRRRRQPPLSRAVFLERRAAVARSLRARRTGARHEVLIDDRPVPYSKELWLPLLWFHLLG